MYKVKLKDRMITNISFFSMAIIEATITGESYEIYFGDKLVVRG